MNITFFGASSQIAKGLIRNFSKFSQNHLTLFVRDYHSFNQWLQTHQISKNNCTIQEYSEFSNDAKIDVIINCVGVGDPAKALEIRSSIQSTTKYYDEIALGYIDSNPETKYFFISSGIAYGDIFSAPARKYTQQNIDMNSSRPEDAYAISKINAEKSHRILTNLSVIDIRIFSYLSDEIDINSRFFISDALRAIKKNKVLYTSNKNITRDYIGADDLYQLITKLINIKKLNTVVDAYSAEPIDKISILNFLELSFGLKYELQNSFKELNATGSKDHYYSMNFRAKDFGYNPKFSSKNVIEDVARNVLER